MSEDIELKLTHSHLKSLSCSICKGYLSSSPIRLASDGSNICGRCSPLNRDKAAYPQPTLEAIMSDAKFPCKYMRNGCDVKLDFNCTVDHEENCEFRNAMDVSQPGCSKQEESTSQCEMKRQTFVLENAEMRVKIDGDNKTFSVKNNGCTVINPLRRRNSSSSSSVANIHNNWNQRRDSNSSVRSEPIYREWHHHYNNYNRENNYHTRRDWNNTSHYRGQEYGNRRPWLFRKRQHKNNLVVIKGRTLYVTL